MSRVTDIKQEDGWLSHKSIEESARIVFFDLPKEKGEAWMPMFPHHSAVSFGNELTYAGYKNLPVSYLLCEKDLCIPLNVQETGIKLIEEASEKKVDVTRIQADHCPNVSATDSVIQWAVDVAGKA
jgi:hypothetical protein